jgi:membrane protein YdbS with pleckstrin-like domain
MEFSNIEILQLPDISKITFKRIHKDYLKVLILTILAIFSVLFLALFLLEKNVEEIASIPYIMYVYFLLLLLFVVLISAFIVGFFRRKYALREKDLTYKSGVFIKTITTVPFSRIQHVEISEAPISRLFKLASLNVFTAGDSSNDLVIKGIKKEEALKIKEFINQQIHG